jgi:hypothetical protein
MTKPTGRPRGRPKTKEYVTLMARVDITLTDQVKRYASLHRQPISVVIRDALILLMEEYPFAGDRSGPHRLAAHEFLSDRYESPLDTLIGETDRAGLDDLLSDTKESVVETILSDTKANRMSAATTQSPETPIEARTQRRSSKTSDRKADASSFMPDIKKVLTEVSSRKRGRPRSPVGQQILALLAEHPEGLSAEQIRGYLTPGKRIGETLSGMKRLGTVQTRGQGKAVRYFAMPS